MTTRGVYYYDDNDVGGLDGWWDRLSTYIQVPCNNVKVVQVPHSKVSIRNFKVQVR